MKITATIGRWFEYEGTGLRFFLRIGRRYVFFRPYNMGEDRWIILGTD